MNEKVIPLVIHGTEGEELTVTILHRTTPADINIYLQDTFLNTIRKSRNPVTLFLVNGVKLQGVITWFDNFSVLLRREGTVQLVYKHAISTIMPSLPIDLLGEDSEEE